MQFDAPRRRASNEAPAPSADDFSPEEAGWQAVAESTARASPGAGDDQKEEPPQEEEAGVHPEAPAQCHRRGRCYPRERVGVVSEFLRALLRFLQRPELRPEALER